MAELAVDTSVAVAHLLRSHTHHRLVTQTVAGRQLCLTAHSLAETYSVLTRLPGDARVAPQDAVRLIDASFGPAVAYPGEHAPTLHHLLAAKGIAGGAVYDAMVAVAAVYHELPLATRDRRAAATYAVLGAEVELIAD